MTADLAKDFEEVRDITVIGAGPVGLSAAFWAGMREASSRIIDSLPEIGGQLTTLYPEKWVFDVPGHPRVLARAHPPVEEAADEVLIAVVPRPFERTEEAPPARALGGPSGERTRPAAGDLREGPKPPREELEERSGRPRAPGGERASDQGQERMSRGGSRRPTSIPGGSRNRQSPVVA